MTLTAQAACDHLNKHYAHVIAQAVYPPPPVLSFTDGVCLPAAAPPSLAQLLRVVNGLLGHVGQPPVGVVWDPAGGGKFVPASPPQAA